MVTGFVNHRRHHELGSGLRLDVNVVLCTDTGEGGSTDATHSGTVYVRSHAVLAIFFCFFCSLNLSCGGHDGLDYVDPPMMHV